MVLTSMEGFLHHKTETPLEIILVMFVVFDRLRFTLLKYFLKDFYS